MEYYQKLYEALCETDIPDVNLEHLKTKYSKEINSIRRKDAIKSLKDLIIILRKRACISVDNVSILEELANYLNIEVPCSYPKLPNVRVTPQILQTPSYVDDILPPVYSTAKARVYDLITREIGTKWRDLGRRLNSREGELDLLEDRYRDIPERMYKILLHFEQSCDKRQWKTKLLNALVDARRKDLKNEAEIIFDTHE